MEQEQLIHTAALLPVPVRRVVEKLAKQMDRSLAAQMRQLTLLALEQLGEWPPRNTEESIAQEEAQHGTV